LSPNGGIFSCQEAIDKVWKTRPTVSNISVVDQNLKKLQFAIGGIQKAIVGDPIAWNDGSPT
jgi:hypothetical protein